MTKIKISYTDDSEISTVLALLDPFLQGKRVKKSDKKEPFKCVYITPKKPANPCK